jgi:lipooligosaccharide transport system permease protein
VITASRVTKIVERNALAYRRMWYVFAAGFLEPILFLLSIGVGVGALVGSITLGNGDVVSYKEFVAPGMLAAAAMNGAVLDTTFNFFVKFKYFGTYDMMLTTPMTVSDLTAGELTWGFLRGTIYSAVFLLTMLLLGLVLSPWAILALPGAVLIGFAFGGAGLAGSTYMRSFIDFDYVNLALMPMFLFSATFFPLDRYPTGLQWVVRCTPLYQGVAIERGLVLGVVDWTLLGHALYLVLMGFAGLRVASRRLRPLLQP